MENFCCVDNDDIIYNQNYPHSFNSIGEKNYTIRKNGKERLPLSQMNLSISKNNDSCDFKSASRIPISSKNVIIKKKGDPLEEYVILDKLGEGTYGVVYKVKNKNNNAIRAMKKISKHWFGNLNDNEVMKEIEILKNLNHPYIIKLYEYYVNDDYIFLINELSEEGDLQGKMRKIKIFPEFIVKIIMLQVFKALMYLNEKSIIHGDLKLENILVVCYENKEEEKKQKNKKNYDNDGFINAIKNDIEIINNSINSVNTFNYKYKTIDLKQINELNKNLNNKYQRSNINSYGTNFKFRSSQKNVKPKNLYELNQFKIFNYGIKLIDFGCSKMFTRTKKSFNDTIGTLVYCSPEVISENYNKMCDIWSCGVLMYKLLSGQFPFYGEDEEDITRAILSGKFDFDVELFNGVSDEAKDLISKCLKYHPNKRISINEALNHRFFKDLKEAKKFTEEDKLKLKSLKKLNKHSKFYQLVLTYLSYNFSDNKLLNELNQLYDKLDKNSDYKITKTELYKAYKEAEIPISQEELDGIINSIDFDNSGNVDYEEFIRMCIPKEKLFTEANLTNAFLLFDKNKKGFITPSEIIDFIQNTRHVNDKNKQKIKEEILGVADEIIEPEEFKTLMLTMSNKE